MSTVINIAMYIVLFVLPLTAIIAGRGVIKNPPEFNGSRGYKTTLSKSSKEAWDYANRRMGELSVSSSVKMMALALFGFAILFFTKSEYTDTLFTIVVLAVVVLQTLIYTLPMSRIDQELEEGYYKVDKEETLEEEIEETVSEETSEESEEKITE